MSTQTVLGLEIVFPSLSHNLYLETIMYPKSKASFISYEPSIHCHCL